MVIVLFNFSIFIFESIGDEDDIYMYFSDEDIIYFLDDEEEIFLKETRKFKKKVGYYYDRYGVMIVRRRYIFWKILKRVVVISFIFYLYRRIFK